MFSNSASSMDKSHAHYSALVRRAAWGLALPMLCSAKAYACAVCYGAEGDPQTAGMNGAILTLLGFVAVIAAGVGGLAFRMMRRVDRAAEVGAPTPSVHAGAGGCGS